MSIRKRIFLSYIVLVSLLVFYFLLLFSFDVLQKRIDKDITALYQSKDIWNDLLISMNELQYNWSDGETFFQFKEKYRNLDIHLKEMSENPGKSIIDISQTLSIRKKDLYETWSIARERVQQIIAVVESSDFQRVIQPLEKSPGLQRLNHLWMDLYFSPEIFDNKDAYVLRSVIDHIEFFPIYSATLNHLFNVMIEETDSLTTYLQKIKYIVTILFFILFLFLYLVFALRFSVSLSEPIKTLSYELSMFMGKTLKMGQKSDSDELNLLSNSVKSLISHYTDLSEIAGRIALGEINTPFLKLQEHGIVGKALKDINIYLQELAETSQWIRDGNYGVEIRVKSDKDILAANFNIMSQVISEKITTLRNIFEAVEESIVVTDSEGHILEANNKFFQLISMESYINLEQKNLKDFFETGLIPDSIYDKTENNIIYSNILDVERNVIPIKIISQEMPEDQSQKDKVMLIITNESVKVRMEREKEKFRSQAIEAELRALRAQINPHFLFNTLNGIAHLIESNKDGAVTMIEKLAELFRYTLVSTRRITVKLSEELNIIKQFMDIEKMRFGDNLTVEYEIGEELTHYQIPPMLLQPVVENAVKYGVDENGKIYIKISIFKEENSLFINVADSGSQVVNFNMLLEQKGTGIRNVNHRLMSLYNQPLQFVQNFPKGLKVIIKIPESLNEFDTNSNN
ncbi:MAG: histidine kinase [Spirochaetaceae bacterium]|jgi:sensor histidine kinase YesM|nr:histidine kinase [Spirochaetaceae bacterium]